MFFQTIVFGTIKLKTQPGINKIRNTIRSTLFCQYTNLLHFTIGGDHKEPGDRSPVRDARFALHNVTKKEQFEKLRISSNGYNPLIKVLNCTPTNGNDRQNCNIFRAYIVLQFGSCSSFTSMLG